MYSLTPTVSRLQGTDIALAADTLYSEGARLRATQDINLQATTVVLDAAHQLASRSESYSNVGKRGQQQNQSQQNTDGASGTIVDAGRNLTLKSSGDTTLIGSALAAGQEMKIEVGGDLALLAAQSTRTTQIDAYNRGSQRATTLTYSDQELRQLLSTISVGSKLTLDVKGGVSAHVGEKNAAGALQADRMTAAGIERGDSRQQVSVTRTGVGATTTPTESQVLGDLAAQGGRNGATDSFAPGATQGGEAALAALVNNGLISLKNQPAVAAALAAPMPSGSALTYQDANGQLSLSVAGQAKVQAVYNQLKLTETFDTQKFANAGTAQIVTLVAAIVLTVCTGGAGAATLGGVLAGGAGTTAAVINAAIIGMSSTMLGQLAGGASFSEAFAAGVKAGAVAAVSAGIASGINQYVNGGTAPAPSTLPAEPGGTLVQTPANAAGSGLSNLDRLGTAAYWQQIGLNAVAQGALAEAQGGSFKDGATGSVLGSLAASGAAIVGDYSSEVPLANIAAHAVLGCAVAASGKKDCAAGAIGGAASATFARAIDGAISGAGLEEGARKAVIAGGSVIGAIGVAAALGKDQMAAGNAAANEVLNNYLNQKRTTAPELSEQEQYDEALKRGDTAKAKALANRSAAQDLALNVACGDRNSTGCYQAIRAAQEAGNKVFADANGRIYAVPESTPEVAASPRAANEFQDRTAQGAAELAALASLATAGGAVAQKVYAMGGVAQTVPLVGGVAELSVAQWFGAVRAGAFFGAASEVVINPDASPASIAIAAVGGAVGGVTKLGLNATYGLANQWVPTTLGNFGTYVAGSQVAGRAVKWGINQTSDATAGTSWWTAPVKTCGVPPFVQCQ